MNSTDKKQIAPRISDETRAVLERIGRTASGGAEKGEGKMKTVNVKIWGGKSQAYAEKIKKADGTSSIVVRVLDPVSGTYTLHHSLTQTQEKYIIGRTL